MARLAIELREDLPPEEVEARLGVTGAQRLFTRPPLELDREHVALRGSGPPLADRCRFYLVEGDAAALAGNALVAGVTVDEPLPPPVALDAAVDDALAELHRAGGRGRGVALAVLGDAAPFAALAPEAAVSGGAPTGVLADAIDQGAARLATGDVLVVPYPVRTAAERAAVAVAASRGILVIASGGVAPGLLAAGADLGGLAARAACIQSLGDRLPCVELIRVLAEGSGAALRLPRERRARVVLRRADIVIGGDAVGTAEIYFEGFIDDGVRHPFRVPAEGAYPFVRDGQSLALDCVLYESIAPLDGPLTVHVEAWDEDLGRASLLNPDDLLGAYEQTFRPADRWGEGVHADIPLKTNQGAWILSYEIQLI